jgi:hypothetical protein
MALKKKVAAKPQVWNKGLEVGKRDGFTPAQVKRIRGLLADRGVPGLRDLALFSTAVDTMLHGQDLLPLVVREVQHRNGSIRPVIEVARARGKPPVRCGQAGRCFFNLVSVVGRRTFRTLVRLRTATHSSLLPCPFEKAQSRHCLLAGSAPDQQSRGQVRKHCRRKRTGPGHARRLL